MQRFLKAAGYLSRRIYGALKEIDESFLEKVCEIRLRADRPISLIRFDGIFYLSLSGRVTSIPANELFIVSINDIKESFQRICEYSVYSYSKDIQQGFITVGGGSRAGIYGTAVYEHDKMSNIRNISGINLRIARQIKGCADELIKLTQSDSLRSILLCGAPSTGKTTMLRDFSRQISDLKLKKVAIVDERGEIAAVSKGIPGNDVGINTDILDGYIKSDGIMQAVRTLSPDIIICDEIEDPHNLGAIIRTAEICGAHGIIIPKRRSASLNATVAKTACGALEYMPVARVTNIANTIDSLKERGVWVFGADMDGEDYTKTDFDIPLALVIGNEGSGIGTLTAKKCDAVISLPMFGKINSLNASVAAGVLMYEVVRKRRKL